MILEVTPSKWLRTFWTSIEPIHCRDPTKDGSLSPTSTRAFVETIPPIEGTLSEHHACVNTYLHPEPNRYLLDLPMVGNRSLHVALLLEPGTDGLKGSVSTAPAVVVNVVLHIVVVTVDASNQGHLEKTHSCGLIKTAHQPFQVDIRRHLRTYVCVRNLMYLSLVQGGMCKDPVRVSEVTILVNLVGKSVGTYPSEIRPVFW